MSNINHCQGMLAISEGGKPIESSGDDGRRYSDVQGNPFLSSHPAGLTFTRMPAAPLLPTRAEGPAHSERWKLETHLDP